MHKLYSLLALAVATPLSAQAPAARGDSARLTSSVASGLKLRSIGPALTSGRVADIAVHPTDKAIWYVAAAAGGVWKTTNAGTSFTPVFDGEGSFSIGAITIDPKNPNIVWVGSGENNAQRVVAYGDGVYKSIDGGKSWTNTGLKESEHIGRIVIDPRNSDVVYVAAQGPLWRKGGDRGVYKTTDGGKTWTKILGVDDWTGRERHSARSTQSGRARRDDVAAEPPRVCVHRRRTWFGRASLDGRRKDVDQITVRVSERGSGPHRSLDVAGRSERRLRDRRGGECQRWAFPFTRWWRELGTHGRIPDWRQLL
jgi:photosystem II stability/assembly factor-like uncharacterized protein